MKNNIASTKKVKKYTTVLLIVILLIITVFLIFNSIGKKKYNVLTFSSKLNLVSFNNLQGDVEKITFSDEIPTSSSTYELLIKNPDKNEFYIYIEHNCLNSRLYKVSFNSFNKNRLKTKLLFKGDYSFYADYLIKGYFDDSITFISNNGDVLYLYNEKISSSQLINFGKDNQDVHQLMANVKKQIDENIDNHHYMNGMAFINDDKVICQIHNSTETDVEHSYFDDKPDKNFIALISLKNNKTIRFMQYGFSPRKDTDGFGIYSSFPISVSPDRKKAAFLIKPATKSFEPGDSIPIHLSLIDLKSYKIEEVVNLNIQSKHFGFDKVSPINWNPARNRNLIAMSLRRVSSLNDFNKKTYGISMIIDVEKKKIIKEWPWESGQMVWSPDGRYLGLLRMESHSIAETADDKDEGSLYVYDLKTDELKKVFKDKSCFDFRWVDL